MKALRDIHWFLAGNLISVFLQGCASHTSPPAPVAAECGQPRDAATAFSQSLYPDLLQNNCKSCHDGSSSIPGFAQSDFRAAYNVANANGFLSLDQPGNARFVTQMNANHNCGANCQAWAQKFVADLQQMKALEAPLPCVSSSPSPTPTGTPSTNNKVLTASMTLNPAQMTLNTDVTMQWDLGQATPSFPNVTFQATVTLTVARGTGVNGSYTIKAPTLLNYSGRNMRINSIDIWINAALSTTSLNFTSVNYIVGQAAPFAALSRNQQEEIFQSATGTDTLAFAFNIASTTDSPTLPSSWNPNACHNPSGANGFVNVYNNVLVGRCDGCHATAGSAAAIAFDMTDPNNLTGMCMAAKHFIADPGNLNSSTLYVVPSLAPMSVTGFPADADKAAISAWAQTEIEQP